MGILPLKSQIEFRSKFLRPQILCVLIIVTYVIVLRGHAVAQCLRHRATNRKVSGSIPESVIWIFHLHDPSGRTVALGSTQPLTEMSTRNISSG
jgi:hypothetical protein